MRAFFVPEAPRDYGFWGVLWCVYGGFLVGGDGLGAGKVESWEADDCAVLAVPSQGAIFQVIAFHSLLFV
jgi:hypothetical protein